MKPNAGVTLLEVLVVAGIFTLAIGLSLTVLSSSRLALTVNEAQVRVQENARRAINQISKELRLAEAHPPSDRPSGGVHIYSNLSTASPNIPLPITGAVVYFQTPLENPVTGTLNLTATGKLQWGSQDNLGASTLGNFIYYYLGGPNLNQLFRATSATPGGGINGAGVVIAPHISSITFERDSATSELIDIEVVAEAQTGVNPIEQILRSRVRLRN